MNPVIAPQRTPHLALPPAVYAELLAYLRESGNTTPPTVAIASAIKLWIAQCRTSTVPVRGYQWKQLFLPETTRVRMRADEEWHHAEVIEDDLIFQGRPVSPHQMAQQVAGDGRNAWRELWIRFPGKKSWNNAAVLRTQLNKSAAMAPKSPADAMAAAAKSMSDALNTALTLVEHANHQSQNTLERRLPRYRRAYDELDDVP